MSTTKPSPRAKIYFYKWANFGLFLFVFVLCTFKLQIKTNFKLEKTEKRSCWPWDSNPGPQDGRRWTLAAAARFIFVCYAAAAAEKEINKWMLTVTLTYASAINPVLLNYHCRPDNKRRKYSFFRLTLWSLFGSFFDWKSFYWGSNLGDSNLNWLSSGSLNSSPIQASLMFEKHLGF